MVHATRKRKSPDEDSVARAIARFRSVLKEKELKNSQVREEIARAAVSYEGHFTVEDLLRVLRARGVHNAHMATLYRAVPLLLEAGLIQPALIAQGESQHYEPAFEREHHDHLVCMGCGRVVEFHSETLEAIQREIAERYAFRLDEHVHELRGLCAACLAKAAKASGKH